MLDPGLFFIDHRAMLFVRGLYWSCFCFFFFLLIIQVQFIKANVLAPK